MYLKNLFQNLRVNIEKCLKGIEEKNEKDLEDCINWMNKYYIYGYPKIVKDIRDNHSEFKILIHQNTHPIYKKLSKKGVKIYYCPKKIGRITGLIREKNAWFGDGKHVIVVEPRIKGFVRDSFYLAKKVSKYIKSKYKKSYFIPPESIDTVFDMIEQKEEPAKIVEYLVKNNLKDEKWENSGNIQQNMRMIKWSRKQN